MAKAPTPATKAPASDLEARLERIERAIATGDPIEAARIMKGEDEKADDADA